MAANTQTIDSQVHCYGKNTVENPWLGFLQGPEQVSGDDMVEAMSEVGVDGALLVSPFNIYGYDPSYILGVYEKHPGKFGLIRPFDPDSSSISVERAEWANSPGVVGARIMLRDPAWTPDHPGLNEILSSSRQQGLPVNIMCSSNLSLFRDLAMRHPETQLVIDHLGIVQPFEPPPSEEPFANLDPVLELAKLNNVAIKISGAGTLSHKPFPYEDIWDPLQRIFDAYGLERCLWGTDWTRAVLLLDYQQGVDAFRLNDQFSESDRSTLMGGSLKTIYKWSPKS